MERLMGCEEINKREFRGQVRVKGKSRKFMMQSMIAQATVFRGGQIGNGTQDEWVGWK